MHFTRVGLYALTLAAGVAALADATEMVRGTRAQGFVTLAAAATLIGIGVLYMGLGEHPAKGHVRNVRVSALLWGLGYVLLVAGTTLGTRTGVVVATLGSAASDVALVLAAWALAGRLAHRVLVVGVAVALAGYAAAAFLVLVQGPAVLGLAFPGHVTLAIAFALTVRTLPPQGRAPFRSRRAVGRKVRRGG